MIEMMLTLLAITVQLALGKGLGLLAILPFAALMKVATDKGGDSDKVQDDDGSGDGAGDGDDEDSDKATGGDDDHADDDDSGEGEPLTLEEWWKEETGGEELPEGVKTPEDLIRYYRKDKGGGEDRGQLTAESLAQAFKTALGETRGRGDGGGGEGSDFAELVEQIDLGGTVQAALKDGKIRGGKDISAQDVAADYAEIGQIFQGPINKKFKLYSEVMFGLVDEVHKLRKQLQSHGGAITSTRFSSFVQVHPRFGSLRKELDAIMAESPRVDSYEKAARIYAIEHPHLLPALIKGKRPDRPRGDKDGGGEDRDNSRGKDRRLAFLKTHARSGGSDKGGFNWRQFMTPEFNANEKEINAALKSGKLKAGQVDRIYGEILKLRKSKGLE